MSIPTTQKAVVVERTGGIDVLEYREDYPVPAPQEGQVLVQNAFSPVNFTDTFFRSGRYPSRKPEILGREGTGTIVALGLGTDKDTYKVGDRVAWSGASGYAEYTVTAAEKTIKLPDALSFKDAAAVFTNGLISVVILHEIYNVTGNEWVLVHAAAGSVGQLLVQILKVLGAKVIATAGGPEKVAVVKSLGADHVIDYLSEESKDWVKEVNSITDNKGVDLILDPSGKDTWQGDLEVIKKKGFIICIGNASGAVPPISLHSLAPKSLRITRPLLAVHIESREDFETHANKLFEYLTSGKVQPRVHDILALRDVGKAHQAIEGREAIGKILLKASTG